MVDLFILSEQGYWPISRVTHHDVKLDVKNVVLITWFERNMQYLYRIFLDPSIPDRVIRTTIQGSVGSMDSRDIPSKNGGKMIT